ncbi:MAG: GNAT family N-acetyltransferase, partial [Egibacteraceae bacterium]
ASDAEWLRRTVGRVPQPSRLIHMPETVSRIRTGLLSWMTQVDGVNHVAVVAEREGACAGLARYVRSRDDVHVAEVAVTVMEGHHDRGIARRLIDALGDIAVENGVNELLYRVHGRNAEVHALLRAQEAYVVVRDGVVERRVRLS